MLSFAQWARDYFCLHVSCYTIVCLKTWSSYNLKRGHRDVDSDWAPVTLLLFQLSVSTESKYVLNVSEVRKRTAVSAFPNWIFRRSRIPVWFCLVSTPTLCCLDGSSLDAVWELDSPDYNASDHGLCKLAGEDRTLPENVAVPPWEKGPDAHMMLSWKLHYAILYHLNRAESVLDEIIHIIPKLVRSWRILVLCGTRKSACFFS